MMFSKEKIGEKSTCHWTLQSLFIRLNWILLNLSTPSLTVIRVYTERGRDKGVTIGVTGPFFRD